MAFYFNKSVTSGKNAKYIALTDYAHTIQGFGNTWYLHIRHGSGSNSYSEFNGDEDAAGTRPQLTIAYEQVTVYVNVEGVWKTCLVYYCNNRTWIQCVPYYNDSGTWKQV